MESLTEINTWLTTLHDIITQEGKRKIFAISENELIKREKKILSAIAVLK